MRLNISARYLVAFLALCFLMFETHEFAHIVTGRMICGGWGFRDFNVWGLRDGCGEAHPIAVLATFAGPIWSYALMWLGARLLSRGAAAARCVGFSLVFANLPLARIVTAATGSGDEIFGLRELFEAPDESNRHQLWLIGGVAILLLTVPPLFAAYKALDTCKRVLVFGGWLVLPMLAGFTTIFGILNPLMGLGMLDDTGFCGSPVLVNVWTALVVVFFALTCQRLTTLACDPTGSK